MPPWLANGILASTGAAGATVFADEASGSAAWAIVPVQRRTKDRQVIDFTDFMMLPSNLM